MISCKRTFRMAIVCALLVAPGLCAQPDQDPAAALFAALKDHDTRTLKSLLAKGVSPSLRDATGHAALGIAAQNGDLDAVRILLTAGADINDADHFGPPIWYAVTFNQLGTVEFLLAHGANVDTRNSMDQTSLIWAVRSHRPEMVELLLKSGADVNAVDRTKVGLLTVASLANDQDIVRALEKAGARYSSAEDEMMAAASFGDAAHIRELLAAGTPVDFAGSSYASPAAGETPLMAASEKGQTVAVRTLLAAHAEVNAVDREHRTALFYAIESAHRSTVDALLAAGADPKAKMGGGSTTLMQLANHMDDPDLARQLIAAGVDPNATTDNSSVFTALNQAATMNHPQVLKVLLEAGADVNFRTTLEGETALIDAARSGASECVQILLLAGADPTIRDHRPNSGKTARDWAVQFHHPDIADMLPAK
jgi:ankyrin repeat protein